MKKWIYILIVLFFNLGFLKSQTYKPVVKQDTSVWLFAVGQLSFSIDSFYAKGEKNGYIEIFYNGDQFNTQIGYWGDIRSNTENSKLWLKAPDDTSEVLIYDISLNKGDSFYHVRFNVYIIVDSIYFLNGLKHIEFNIGTEWKDKVQFIEGVGPNQTLFWPWLSSNQYVVCKYEKDSLIYHTPNENFRYCKGINTYNIDKYNFREDIIIFPNPFNNYLFIQLPDYIENKDVIVKIMNLTGKIVFKKNKVEDKEIFIDTSFLKSGIYIVSVSDNWSLKHPNWSIIFKP